MNQHLLVKTRQLGATNPGDRLTKAGPVSGAQSMSKANALAAAITQGLSWRLVPWIGAFSLRS